MSGANKETQAIFVGVAAIAAAGLLYFAYSQSTEPTTEKNLLSGDDDIVSKRSQETSKTSNIKTPAESITGESKMDDKALHAAIEELDKKGKAYFKNKQVSKDDHDGSCCGIQSKKRSHSLPFLRNRYSFYKQQRHLPKLLP